MFFIRTQDKSTIVNSEDITLITIKTSEDGRNIVAETKSNGEVVLGKYYMIETCENIVEYLLYHLPVQSIEMPL